MTTEARGSHRADISNAIVQVFRECYGRGPTKAKTYLFDNYVFVVTEDLLTTVEETLVKNGHEDKVREVRLIFQEAVAERFKGAVERVVDRKVVTYHSQVVFDPPMGFEIFVLDEPPAT